MSKPLKLLMITHNYPRFSGDYAGVFLSLLARKLITFDIEPVVLAPHAPGLAEYEILEGVKVYRFRYNDDVRLETIAYQGNMHKLVLGSVSGIFQFKAFLNAFRKAAVKIIHDEQIDVIGGHWLIPAGLVMKPLSKKFKIPMILSSHGTDIRLMRKYFKVIYRYLKSFCYSLKSWTVVSSFLRNDILSMDPKLSNILEVLPLPHDESIFYQDETVVRDDSLIVSVTRFTEQKRVLKLVQAFALLTGKNDKARLEIYGAGPLQEAVQEEIRKFGLEKRISIKKPVAQADLRTIYNRASMVVLNSFEEGFGLTLSEAMLCGTAVIGTDSGGIKDIIAHEDRGLLVRLDHPEELSSAMLRLLNDIPLRNRLAVNGKSFAEGSFKSEPLARRYAEIIKAAYS